MKRLLLSGVAAAMVAGGAGMAFAGGPGPIGPNNFGLCTAYAHNGGGNSHSAPPFQALQDQAQAANESVAQWCAANGTQPGGSGH